MRPSPAQIERVAGALVERLGKAQVLEPAAPEETIRARFSAILTQNFDQEEEIAREAETEAQRLVRQGAPGVRRDEVDLRRVEQLVKQRIAKARGFAL